MMNNTNDRKIWMYVIVALYGVFLFRILLLREAGCYPFYYNSIQLSINGSPEKPYLEKGFSYMPFAYWGVGDSLGIYRAWVRSLFILSGYAEQFESSTFLSFLFRYLTEYSRSWWGRYEMVNILSLSKNTVIYIYLTCSTVILLLLAKVFYVRKDELKKDIPGDKTFMKMLPDYSLIIIIMLLLSPISWQHHYVLLFIPCFYFSMYILRNGIKHDKITSALVIVPFLITGLTSPIFVGAEADRVFKAYDVFSISAFMLLAALIRIRIVSGRKSGNKQIV